MFIVYVDMLERQTKRQ